MKPVGKRNAAKGVDITDTQARILEVGRREFLEKGFKGASLRAIVKEAGFTQGAFYGYYDSKEALFAALVAPADELVERFKRAQDAHFDLIREDRAAESRELSTEYLRSFVGYIYDNFEAFKLVLCCSAGTRYENYVHDLVELEVCGTRAYYAELEKRGRLEGAVSDELQRMLTSAYFAAVFETVVHDMPRTRAMGYIEELAVFFQFGLGCHPAPEVIFFSP